VELNEIKSLAFQESPGKPMFSLEVLAGNTVGVQVPLSAPYHNKELTLLLSIWPFRLL
jgi:hypothetical protein